MGFRLAVLPDRMRPRQASTRAPSPAASQSLLATRRALTLPWPRHQHASLLEATALCLLLAFARSPHHLLSLVAMQARTSPFHPLHALRRHPSPLNALRRLLVQLVQLHPRQPPRRHLCQFVHFHSEPAPRRHPCQLSSVLARPAAGASEAASAPTPMPATPATPPPLPPPTRPALAAAVSAASLRPPRRQVSGSQSRRRSWP